MGRIKKTIINSLDWLILVATALLCVAFIALGSRSENGSITIDGNDAKIEEYTKEFIEDSNTALARLMNHDQPTDQLTIDENSNDATGQGFTTTIDDIIARRLNDNHNDGGNGWQCSRYTGWLATGKWSYSVSHPDYGPVNGKDVANWLVKNYGFKYIDQPVYGAIGSGGFNTTYGHTAMFLYSTGTDTAMVNDANWKPLAVATHNMNISDWVWVVPGNYESPKPDATPSMSPTNDNSVVYIYKKGDTFGQVIKKLGMESDAGLWGENGDVRFYSIQLADQGIIVGRDGKFYGNIPVGREIVLEAR